MTEYKIQIYEKKKYIRKLTFLNLKEEVTNFMYKRTVAASSRGDLLFFVLIFFLSIKSENSSNSLLKDLLEQNIGRLKLLNEMFATKKNQLKKYEYREVVESLGLQNLVKYDVIFLLIEAIENADLLEVKYRDYFLMNPELLNQLNYIVDSHGKDLSEFYTVFKGFDIEDDRYNSITGHYLDLSKSVYRPIKMRTRRKLDISLQQFTEITRIKSESPILVEFIQSIDPQIIFELWDKYHLASYIQSVWVEANNSPIISNFIGGGAAGSIVAWIQWKNTKDPNEKDLIKKELDKQKVLFLERENELLRALNHSIKTTPEKLANEVKKLREEILILREKEKTKEEKRIYSSLKLELRNLENLSVVVNDKIDSEITDF